MQIVEVKNNLVKVSYDPTQDGLVLSGFLFIKNANKAFISQIIYLEANQNGSFAVSKLLFNFAGDGVISSYDGSIPDLSCEIELINPQELLGILPVQDPILMGELAQQKALVKVDRSFFEETLLVCCENAQDRTLLTKNINAQLASGGKKLLIIDINGDLEEKSDFKGNKIVAGENFKLPLNYETINFIYEKGLDDAKPETKALIQEIFLEVQNYVKTLPEKFIPFETFKDVVDQQYEQMELVELVLLKNKLLKYYENGVFAQEKSEFESLEASLRKAPTTVLDLSNVEEKIQREMISYAYSLMSQLKPEFYVIVNINDSNSDKKLLKQILTTDAYSTIVCSYSYKYLKELKQVSKNLILFAPIQQQNDFAGYSSFLNKLNAHEFIIYGAALQHIPLIIKLDETPQSGFETRENKELDEEIRRDVDSIYTAAPSQSESYEITPETLMHQQAPSTPEDLTEEDLTEEDLDFIDGNIIEDDFQNNGQDTIVLEKRTQEPIEITEHEPEEGLFENFAEEELQMGEPQAEPPSVDILPASISSTPIVPPAVPIYSADIEAKEDTGSFEKGDIVSHPKYGKGTVEKLISYGSKTLCSIHFDNVGRRLLDPALAEIKKI